jgi:hypothetical protein
VACVQPLEKVVLRCCPSLQDLRASGSADTRVEEHVARLRVRVGADDEIGGHNREKWGSGSAPAFDTLTPTDCPLRVCFCRSDAC